jgi:nucleoside-diphosphate-sugar epimerase
MIAVTGGTGLLGGHLLLELTKHNTPVKALIRKEGNSEKVLSIWKYYVDQPESLMKKIHWLPIDFSNKSEFLETLENVDELYHCAGMVSFNPRDNMELYKTNVEATANIVNACLELGNARLLHVSSIAAIGKSDQDILTEDSGWTVNTKSVYSKTKTLGELEVWRGIAEGLDAIIINPSIILGPGHWKDSSSRIFDVVYNGMKYYTLGETGFIDIQDVVAIMIKLMKSEISGERFILNSENLSYRAIFSKIAEVFNINPPYRYANPFMTSLAWRAELLKYLLTGNEPRVTKQTAQTSHKIQQYSSEKIRKKLGIKFNSIDNTINRIAKFYLASIES